ncbi:bifunctional SANT-Myb domain/Myb domain/Homeobox-like domain superfamily [Babesia duncani]|uniref:Bifunctional SANT-Myb domain/Myb domain/Homeobox-like domain superfamily n=1 Tax=Babesia duncani TaxID=323732 RepID=A0AAD9UP22_9APIC|nr:bifunctional SANT-Myb domain/Myb domain/Homeobox-like domain superfamily [Babesia duncani]
MVNANDLDKGEAHGTLQKMTSLSLLHLDVKIFLLLLNPDWLSQCTCAIALGKGSKSFLDILDISDKLKKSEGIRFYLWLDYLRKSWLSMSVLHVYKTIGSYEKGYIHDFSYSMQLLRDHFQFPDCLNDDKCYILESLVKILIKQEFMLHMLSQNGICNLRILLVALIFISINVGCVCFSTTSLTSVIVEFSVLSLEAIFLTVRMIRVYLCGKYGNKSSRLDEIYTRCCNLKNEIVLDLFRHVTPDLEHFIPILCDFCSEANNIAEHPKLMNMFSKLPVYPVNCRISLWRIRIWNSINKVITPKNAKMEINLSKKNDFYKYQKRSPGQEPISQQKEEPITYPTSWYKRVSQPNKKPDIKGAIGKISKSSKKRRSINDIDTEQQEMIDFKPVTPIKPEQCGVHANFPKKKTKKYNRWDDKDVQALVNGVNEFKIGNWAKIAIECFEGSKTGMQLKDKWANLQRYNHVELKDQKWELVK